VPLRLHLRFCQLWGLEAEFESSRFHVRRAANRSLEILWNVSAFCLTPSLSRLAGEPKGLDRLERSYLSLDTDGRVVRLDSFAKFLAPGLRLGWATGAPAIIQKLVYCITGSSLGACSTTQVRVSAIQKLQQ